MSLGSRADIIPYTRFLDCRQRLRRIAAANGAVVMPASTAVGLGREVDETANDDDFASSRDASATVRAPMPHGGMAKV
jgi:hypothetical protein